MRPTRLLAALCASVVVVLPAGAYAAPTSASAAPAATNPCSGLTKQEQGSATFGSGPANKHKPDGRTYFNYDTSAGGQASDHLAVLNLTCHPEILRVYTVDVVPGSNGSFLYQPRSAKRIGAGAWVAVGTPHASGVVRVGKRSTTVLPVHLHVPANASPGDHVGAIIVSLTSLVKGKGPTSQRVHFEQRVANRVIVRVAGKVNPQLSIENLHAKYEGTLNPTSSGKAKVTYTVRNTGNAILGATQQVSVHGLFGSTAHAKPLPVIQPLLPGGAITVTATVPGVYPELLETAHVTINPESLAGDANPGLHPVSSSVHFLAIPWIIVLVLVLLILYFAWRYWRRRRRRHVEAAVSGGSRPEPEPQGAAQ
jgi:hypothetical protein